MQSPQVAGGILLNKDNRIYLVGGVNTSGEHFN
jgi:hypothetical protein